jgi:hypothetical protein
VVAAQLRVLRVQAVYKAIDTPQLHRQHLHWVMQGL